MVSIDVEDLVLTYRVRQKFSLALRDKRLSADQRIAGSGRSRYVTALNGLTFSLKPGDRLGLVGTNGSGKTTLLNVLYGIYAPTGGKVSVNGRVDALFNISLGFRREATGRRNIVLRGLINGRSEEEIAACMDQIIEFSELGDFIDMPLKSYSQGMAARLAFSVATTLSPEILLLDEWIGVGDPSFQEKAKTRMKELSEQAMIMIVASHNYALLKKSCNLIMELDKGRLKSLMPADEWFSRSAEK